MTKSKLKKHGHVYAVVGAACCNADFRARLFRAYDPLNSTPVRKVVNGFLDAAHLQGPIADKDLNQVLAFVAPRSFKPLVLPPAERAETRWLRARDLSFEAACEAFWNIICPIWPCDDSSD
jgi:hypothetical protein